MTRHTLWIWLGSALLTTSLVGVGHAESYDRDRAEGAGRSLAFQQRLAAHEMSLRPNLDSTISGRSLGRDSVTTSGVGREFHNAQEVTSHFNTQVKMRATAGGEASGDDVRTLRVRPNSHHGVTTPSELDARDRGRTEAPDELVDHRSPHERQILGTSITGRPLGQNTIQPDDVYRDFKSKGDMLAHMNTQVKMRLQGEASPDAGESAANHVPGGTNRGDEKSNVSNPAQLTSEQRAKLCAEGACFARPQVGGTDIEDKTR